LQRATALDRGRVKQQQIAAAAWALGGEDADQPLDRLRQPRPPLVQSILRGQLRKQVAELPPPTPALAPTPTRSVPPDLSLDTTDPSSLKDEADKLSSATSGALWVLAGRAGSVAWSWSSACYEDALGEAVEGG